MRRRCAIYTRKSTEEGLDQDFNSLDAQRAACEAYIMSQKAEGWEALPETYDDGGLSGGTLDRPALQRLLDAIRRGRIDTVVVYKVDRLTRSLGDFAKIVEVFDGHDVSFVSVTQQFNTTTSMGRLTLNMLLSFAQFEREVTAERIRDKIAASKKKGLWMGGTVPVGYDAVDRKLVINEEEAETVRTIFRLYLERATVRRVKEEADRLGLTTRRRTRRDGTRTGGAPFTRGHIHKILTNPVYLGEIAHKGERYPGEHPPVITRAQWDAVQRQLEKNAATRRCQTNARSPSLLTGLLETAHGHRFKPAHASKDGRRYHYYIAQPDGAWRLPAPMLDDAVVRGIAGFLNDRTRLSRDVCPTTDADRLEGLFVRAADVAGQLQEPHVSSRRRLVIDIVDRVIVDPDRLRISIRGGALQRCLGSECGEEPSDVQIVVPIAFRKRGVETRLLLDDGCSRSEPDDRLIALLVQARQWFEALRTGEVRSVTDLARRQGIDQGDVSRILPLNFLAPDIVVAILEGRQPPELTAAQLKRVQPLPVEWTAQRRRLGFL